MHFFIDFLRISLPRHFFVDAGTKNIDMPRQKPRHLPTAEINFKRCTGKT